jgi:ABC-2 type transport system permease protein
MSALTGPARARADRFAALSREPFDTVSSRSGGLARNWKSLREILRRRELLVLLIRRDLKARYKDSALGFVWSLIRPLTQFAIYYLVVGQILSASRGIPDFAVFVFSGLTLYGLFSETIGGATSSIIANSGLIKKVQLPREIFPLASVGSGLFNFGIQLIVLIIASLLLGGLDLGWHLLYAPAAIVVVLLYATAFGIFLSAVNVFLRDVQYLIELALMVLMWASPIVYSWTMVHNLLGNSPLLEIYTDNPLTLAVLAFQRAFRAVGIAGVEYPAHLEWRLLVAAVIAVILIVGAQRIFARLEGNFAQEL